MDIMRELMTNGFLIYPSNGKFVVKKQSVPTNSMIIGEQEYDSYDLALEAATNLLNSPPLREWEALVRYNRGLGIEYKKLPDVSAFSREEAQKLAETLGEQLLGGPKVEIKEVRVRPKG